MLPRGVKCVFTRGETHDVLHGAEVEAALGRDRLLEGEGVGVGIHRRREVLVLLVLQAEVRLQDLDGLLVGDWRIMPL